MNCDKDHMACAGPPMPHSLYVGSKDAGLRECQTIRKSPKHPFIFAGFLVRKTTNQFTEIGLSSLGLRSTFLALHIKILI